MVLSLADYLSDEETSSQAHTLSRNHVEAHNVSHLEQPLYHDQTGRPIPYIIPPLSGNAGSVASMNESSVSGVSRYSAASLALSRTNVVTPVGKMMSSMGSGMFSMANLQPKRTYTFKKRKESSAATDFFNKSKRRKTQMSPDAILALITTDCCPHQCLKQIPVSAFEKIRARHLPESQGHINGVLMDIISRAYNSDSKLGKKYIYMLDTGHAVCAKACATVFGKSLSHFRKLAKMVDDGQVCTFRKPRTHARNTWQSVFVPFLDDYADRYGQKMPNKSTIELCVGNKIQIIKKFLVHAETMPEYGPPPDTGTCYKLWDKFGKHVICPKRNSFAKCTACTSFKTDLAKVLPLHQRQKIVQAFDRHLDHQMKERMQYYANRNHARIHPEEAMSVILDGMTQSTTALPWFPHGAPKSVGGIRYDVHVFGALIHGHTPRVLLHDAGVPTGPNLTIQSLWRIMKLYGPEKLPPLLYLQLDNTSSDNKNHHVLEFCSFLVENRYFQQVIFLYAEYVPLSSLLLGENWIHDGRTHT